MDAFDVLQQSLGPALQALDNGNRQRLQVAMLANQRANERAREESERSFRRGLIEDERRFTERHEQRLRSEKKEDAAETRLREMKQRIISRGGTVPPGATEESLAAMDSDLGLQWEIKKTEKMKEGDVLAEARLLKVPTDGRPIGDIANDVAMAKQEKELALQASKTEGTVQLARKSPDYQTRKENLAFDLIRRQQALASATAQMPSIQSEESKAVLGKLYATDQEMAQLLAKKVPGGAIILQRLRDGVPGAYEQALTAVGNLPEAEKMEFQEAWTRFAATAQKLQAAEYGGEVNAYLKQISILPGVLRGIDESIQGHYKDPVFGPALQRESVVSLINEHAPRFSEVFQASPGAGKGQAAASNERGQLPPLPPPANGNGSPAPQPGAPNLTPVGAVNTVGVGDEMYGPEPPAWAIPQQVQGIIPGAIQAGASMAGRAVAPPLEAIQQGARAISDASHNARARLWGGYIIPKPPEDPRVTAQRQAQAMELLRIMGNASAAFHP